MADSARSSVTSVSIEISGSTLSEADTIGARGSREGTRRSAAQSANTNIPGAVGLLGGLLIQGVAAAKGAAEAQPHVVVDEARAGLQGAMQQADFGERLKARLVGSRAGGSIEVAAVVVGGSRAPLDDAAGRPVSQVVSLEYRLMLFAPADVNPDIGLVARVTARVRSPDRLRVLHTATWTYCGERRNFVQMGANDGALLRRQIDSAAAVLAPAILHDLYVGREPRKAVDGCMDFADLAVARP